jgi:uncharacterized protein
MWLMHQQWSHLLFAHWPLPASVVNATLPPGLTADLFEGNAWISVVPFLLDYTVNGLQGLPLPKGNFAELNLRTYVRHGNHTGVYFYTLEDNDLLSVWGANAVFKLAYRFGRIRLTANAAPNAPPLLHCVATRSTKPGPIHVDVTYQPDSEAETLANQADLTRFLTERYQLLTCVGNRWHTVPINHKPWPLQPVTVNFAHNNLPEAFGLRLENPLQPVLAHYSAHLTVKTGWLKSC